MASGAHHVGGFVIVEYGDEKLVALELCTPSIKYTRPNHVNELLGAPTAKGSSSPARTMSLKAVHTAVYGEAVAQTVDAKATTIVLDFEYFSLLLGKRVNTSTTWRGRPFTTLTELQVVLYARSNILPRWLFSW